MLNVFVIVTATLVGQCTPELLSATLYDVNRLFFSVYSEQTHPEECPGPACWDPGL